MKVDWPKTVMSGVVLLGLYAGYRKVTARPPVSPPVGPVVPTTTKHLSDGFFRQVSDAAAAWRAKGSRVTGEDLLMALYGESEVKPWKGNEWGYAGLNGMGGKQRKALGFRPMSETEWQGLTEEQKGHHAEPEWRALSAEQQMPYVRRFLEGNVRDFAKGDFSTMSDVGRLYLLNIMPALIYKPDDHVVFPKGSTVYARNSVIDRERKGFVEVGDMRKYMQYTVTTNPGYWAELRSRLRAVEQVA